jgi:hypothetical protein
MASDGSGSQPIEPELPGSEAQNSKILPWFNMFNPIHYTTVVE